jgi:hypothetical protein
MRLKLCLLLGSAAVAMAAVAQAQDEGSFPSREHSLTERLNRQQLAIHTMPRASWHRRWYWAWDAYEYRWVPRYEERAVPRHSGYRSASFEYARVVPIARPEQPDIPQARDAAAANPTAKSETVATREEPKSPHADTDNKPKATGDHSVAVAGRGAKTETVASLEESKSTAPDLNSKPVSKEAPAEAKPVMVDAKPLTPTEIRAAVPLEKVSDPKQALASAEIRSLWGDTIGKVRGVDLDNGAVKTVDADLAGGKRVVKMDAARLKFVKSRNVVLTSMSKADVEKLPKQSS